VKRYRCIECKHCNEDEKKCYPQSKDCQAEYDLTEDDIYEYSTERCDFFEAKVEKMEDA